MSPLKFRRSTLGHRSFIQKEDVDIMTTMRMIVIIMSKKTNKQTTNICWVCAVPGAVLFHTEDPVSPSHGCCEDQDGPV